MCLWWGASRHLRLTLTLFTQGERDPAATSSTLRLQENMKTS